MQKAWYLKFNDPDSQRALWLRFTALSSSNGFKRVAETWAVYFHKNSNRDIKKLAIKQSYEIEAFSTESNQVRIGDSFLSTQETQGTITSKGNTLEWKLTLVPADDCHFNLIPEVLSKTGLVKNSIFTVSESLLVTGTVVINGETIHWKQAPGMSGQMNGPKAGHSWVWGQSNSFVNEQGRPVPFIFEGLTAKAQLGPMVTPKLSSFFFRYQDKNYYFNTLRDLFYLKSNHSLNEWQFQAERGDLSFRGTARAEHKDFAGLTFEDTNGSLLYCANSKLSDMKVHVYRRGKLEATFISEGTAAFEVVTRNKNPYVPIII
jgi:hypothetical protein